MSDNKSSKFRDGIFNNNDAKRGIIEFNGHKCEVRSMSMRKSKEIQLKSDEDSTGVSSGIYVLMETLYDPETGEKVFKPEDYDALLDLPDANMLTDLIEKVAKILNPSFQDVKKT